MLAFILLCLYLCRLIDLKDFSFTHISPCDFSSFCVILFSSSFFSPFVWSILPLSSISNQKKKKNAFQTKIQLNERPDQTNKQKKKKKPAQTPTHQAEPSGPPQDVRCYSSSSTNILVSWRPPPVELQNGIITQYAIQYAATEGEDTTTQQITGIPPESSEYLLENLEKWTEYQVTVTAHTDVGAGPESLPQLIRTEEDGMCSLKQSPSCKSSLPLLTTALQILTTISTIPFFFSTPSACL